SARRSSAWSSPIRLHRLRLEQGQTFAHVSSFATVAEVDEEQRVSDRADAGEENLEHDRYGVDERRLSRRIADLASRGGADGERNLDQRGRRPLQHSDDETRDREHPDNTEPLTVDNLAAS